MFSVDEGPSVRPWIYLCLPGVHPCAACGCLESNVRRFCTASTGRGKCIGRTWRFGAIVWASSRYHRSIAKACVPESMPWFTNEGQEMKFQFFKKRLRSKFKFRFPRKNNLRLYTFRIPHNEVFPYTFKLRVWSSGPYGGNDDRGRPRYRGRVCLQCSSVCECLCFVFFQKYVFGFVILVVLSVILVVMAYLLSTQWQPCVSYALKQRPPSRQPSPLAYAHAPVRPTPTW